jgi:hypothetical protein
MVVVMVVVDVRRERAVQFLHTNPRHAFAPIAAVRGGTCCPADETTVAVLVECAGRFCA